VIQPKVGFYIDASLPCLWVSLWAAAKEDGRVCGRCQHSIVSSVLCRANAHVIYYMPVYRIISIISNIRVGMIYVYDIYHQYISGIKNIGCIWDIFDARNIKHYLIENIESDLFV